MKSIINNSCAVRCDGADIKSGRCRGISGDLGFFRQQTRSQQLAGFPPALRFHNRLKVIKEDFTGYRVKPAEICSCRVELDTQPNVILN